jgi:hypothetical protein
VWLLIIFGITLLDFWLAQLVMIILELAAGGSVGRKNGVVDIISAAVLETAVFQKQSFCTRKRLG